MMRSHPNKAVDVVVPTSEKTLWYVFVQLLSARILLSKNLILEMAFSLFACFTSYVSLRRPRHRHRRPKAQRLVHLSRHPESM